MADPVDRSGFGVLLRQHRLDAGLTQAALAERAGLAERTVQDLERAVARPLRETIRRLVAALEPTPEARAQFEAAISAPRRHRGPTPRPRPRDVRPVVQDVGVDVPAIVSLDAWRRNLPIQTTPLLGRDQDVRGVISLLLRDDVRLVTLTGPGGTGKTRLGLQVAAEMLDRFEDGAYFVELAPISDPSLVTSAVTEVLGLRDLGGRPALERLKAYLRPRSILLALDNFEQILPAAPVVADLLASSPGLKVLVTSREPLRVRGEHECAVPPLALPDVRAPATPSSISRYAAVALFIERAVAIRTDFAVTAENAPAVAEICMRLDGLPLAIELAAARVRLLMPQAMVGRLERRLPLLTGGARDLPLRQQTLRDTIAWSHDLLDDTERRLYRRLSVFVGGWSLHAAEAVCNPDGDVDILGRLESLVAKSLVRQEDNGHGDVRFRMLETIREYADEQLQASGELDLLQRRHADYFLKAAEQAGLHLDTSEQVGWLRRLSPEHDNIRSVLAWSQTHDGGAVGLRLAGALHLYWRLGGHVNEGRRWLTELLALTGGVPLARAQALLVGSMLAMVQADFEHVHVLARRSAETFGKLGQRAGAGHALTYLAVGLMGDGRYVEARPILEESVALCRQAGDRWGLSNALGQFSSLLMDVGDLPAALVLRREALVNAREQGDRWQIGLSLMGVARILREQGEHRQTEILYREALTALGELDDVWLGPRALTGLASVAALDAECIRAARLFGAAEAIRELGGTREFPSWHAHFDRDISAARHALGAEVFAAACAEGRAMPLKQAIAYALQGKNPV